MTIQSFRKTFINELEQNGYEPEFIEKIANDVHMLMWVEHCLLTMPEEYPAIGDLFADVGFIEGMEMQADNPITFDEMKGEE